MSFIRAPTKRPDLITISQTKESVLRDIREIYQNIIQSGEGKSPVINNATTATLMMGFPSVVVKVPQIVTAWIPQIQADVPLPFHVLCVFLYVLRYVLISKYTCPTEKADASVKTRFDHFVQITDYELSYFNRHLGIYKDAAENAVNDVDLVRGRDAFLRANEVFLHRMFILIGHHVLNKNANNPIFAKGTDSKNKGVIAFTEGILHVSAPPKPNKCAPSNDRHLWEYDVFCYVKFVKAYNECLIFNKLLTNEEIKVKETVTTDEEWVYLEKEPISLPTFNKDDDHELD
jgi:hypothetical protein